MNEEPPNDVGRGPTTLRFVRQHEELTTLAKQLVKTLDTRTIEVDPTPVRRLLATFSGRLRVHAAMEQEALYPRLLASEDQAVVAKAKELLEEVGGIYDLFFAHLAKWSDAASIQKDAEGFCRDTMMLLHRLRVRMKRENEELYPLVDRVSPAQSGEVETVKLGAETRRDKRKRSA